MSSYRSPYDKTFDVVDKFSTYEDGNISCMCEVSYFIWKFISFIINTKILQIGDYDATKMCGIIIRNVKQKHYGIWK